MSARQLQLYSTPPHECSYLPDLIAVNAVLDPAISLNNKIYAQLVERGFRRSGDHLYAPHCPECSECLASRVPVADFSPSRSQRRCLKRNQDLTVEICDAVYTEEYFELYRRYLNKRHTKGGMDDTTPERFTDFLLTDWCNTRFVEFRDQGRLLSVAVVDIVPQGISAVYTFFDPQEQQRGLGTLAPLWLIQLAAKTALPWVYLGYYIKACKKMSYKANFKPLQIFRNGSWQLINQ